MQKMVCIGILVAVLAFGSTAEPTSWPGKFCTVANGDTDCERVSSGLVCALDRCTCENPRAFYYGSHNKCVLPESSPCDSTTPNSDMTPHALCNTNLNLVECEPEYFAVNTRPDARSCVLLSENYCSTHDQCDEDKFQKCAFFPDGWRCGCDDNSFPNADKVCEQKAKKECKISSPFPIPECHQHSTCISGSCACNPGLQRNPDGLCRILHGGDCSKGTETPCDENLKYSGCDASRKQCLCNGEGTTSYYDSHGKCVLAPNAECEIGTNKQVCGQNSRCHDRDFKCVCNDGFDKGQEPKCVVLYGKPCVGGNSDQCDKAAGLKCDGDDATQGVCLCERKEEMIEMGGICKIKANEYCYPPGGADDQCVPNAICGSGNTCSCVAGMSETKTGECALDFGSICEATSVSCNPDKFLECDATINICACQNPAKTWFNNYSRTCELLLGAECRDAQKCSSNPGVECMNVGGSSSKVCQCKDVEGEKYQQLVPSRDGTQCYASYNKSCNPNDYLMATCNPEHFLECNGEKCVCSGYGDAWFNTESQKCEKFIGATCEMSPVSQPCTEKSSCDALTNTCVCGPGLVASDDRKSCIETIGAPCTSDSTCSKERHFVCIEGKCACDNSSWFNPKRMMCELLAGKDCDTNSGSQSCIEFSYCAEEKERKCSCYDGYVESSDGKCVASFGAPCGTEYDAECNSDEFLTCNGGTCSCHSDSWFNPHTTSCQLLAGKSCKSGSKDQQCTDNSQCIVSGEGKITCECEEEFVPTLNGQCAKGFGSSCVRSDSECADFLVCEEKTCICNYDAWFNNATKRCELFVGEFCVPGGGNQACTIFSTCERKSSGGGYECKCTDGFNLSDDKRCIHMTCGFTSLRGLLARKDPRRSY